MFGRSQVSPVAVEYLNSFNNGALDRVRLIVATHWHDDHIRGLASVLERLPQARFACSAALNTDNFATLVEAGASTIQGRSGVDEFAAIFRLLVENAPTEKSKRLAAPQFAIENRTLLSLPADGRPFSAAVKALSPSDGTVRLALTDIARWLPKAGEAQRRIINRSPNSTSVVLWVEVGTRRALLGADLEHTAQSGEGWIGVLTCHRSAELATVFKVPHHGSANADYADIWAKMLVQNPVAIVTPFNAGKSLPQSSDLERLSRRTDRLYCTAGAAGKPPSRGAMVDRTVRHVAMERRVIDGEPGHIRVRWPSKQPDVEPTVELLNGAYAVAS